MARKKKSEVIQWPGTYERLHQLADNLAGKDGTKYGYLIITVDPEFSIRITTNYMEAERNEKIFFANVLHDLLKELLRDVK